MARQRYAAAKSTRLVHTSLLMTMTKCEPHAHPDETQTRAASVKSPEPQIAAKQGQYTPGRLPLRAVMGAAPGRKESPWSQLEPSCMLSQLSQQQIKKKKKVDVSSLGRHTRTRTLTHTHTLTV